MKFRFERIATLFLAVLTAGLVTPGRSDVLPPRGTVDARIRQATYDSDDHSFVNIQPGGTVSPGGVATGNEADGDAYRVKVTGGSGLYVVNDIE